MEQMDIKNRWGKWAGSLAVMAVLLLVVLPTKAQKSSLLWKIENPKTKAVSYIFGTYHLIGSAYLDENAPVKKAYEESETVVIETELDSSAMMMVAMKAMMLDNSLKSLVDSADYVLLKQEIEPIIGMPISQFDNVKPIMLSTMYSVAKAQEVTPKDFTFDGTPIDLFFAEDGKEKGKKVVPLETAMEQAEILFDSQTVEEQAAALVENVKAELEDDLSAEILDAYQKQDLDKLWELSQDWDESMGEMTLLLDDRNKKWIPKLKPLLDEGKVFIAVGALHLPGEMGVLELLKAEGYKVSSQ
ncbi:TraB/GumN family protein [Owenweeksia hongkongensis]|uniref:TraB/GumN family protein n=1 Tax=Owenweeksia hongkongensis TaxID=253245 RepID=UPI003A92CC6E